MPSAPSRVWYLVRESDTVSRGAKVSALGYTITQVGIYASVRLCFSDAAFVLVFASPVLAAFSVCSCCPAYRCGPAFLLLVFTMFATGGDGPCNC